MITCIIKNNINNEFIPDARSFDEWVNATGYKENVEINIKIVTEPIFTFLG